MKPLSRLPKGLRIWSGWLLLLPIVVLGVVGVVLIQNDKVSVKLEATDYARWRAEALADACWNQLMLGGGPTGIRSADFQVDNTGRLISPPPIDSTLLPPALNPESLTPEQNAAWRQFNSDEQTGRSDSALEAGRNFFRLTPPNAFAASAAWRCGLLLLKARRLDEAETAFEEVSQRFPEARGETGLPLAPLVNLKLFEIAVQRTNQSAELAASIRTLCSNAVLHPTLISADLLRRVEGLGRSTKVFRVNQWLDQWRREEGLRNLHAEIAPELTRRLVANRTSTASGLVQNSEFDPASRLPVAFWVNLATQLSTPKRAPLSDGASPPPGRTLVVSSPGGSNIHWVALTPLTAIQERSFMSANAGPRSATIVRSPVRMWRINSLPVLPKPPPDDRQSDLAGYLGVSMDLAGQTILSPKFAPTEVAGPSGKTGGPHRAYIDPEIAPSEILATARRPVDGTPQLVVRLHLTQPDQLFARQRQRRDTFGLIVAASLLMAGLGLVAARRAFQRQLALNEMKSNFVSSVSHELRAPIASVRLMADGLERGTVTAPEKQGEYFRFIVQECRRLTSLIENVLDFSRIEQGRKQYDLEPTDLLALTEQTVELMRPIAAEKGVALVFQAPGAGPSALGFQLPADGRALQQALVNLIDNALKHSPAGQTVTVGLESRATDPSSTTTNSESGFHLFVEDRGDGIPAGEHAKIFERFYRCGSELRRETQGVGIGLSIVKHIVEGHGARVTVRSAPGQGSRFTIELPITNRHELAG